MKETDLSGQDDTPAMAAFNERQHALIARMARAWAKDEGEEDLFDEDRPRRPGERGGEVYESYMGDTTDLLEKSGLVPLLPMAEMLSRNPPKIIGPVSTLEEVEALIASLTAGIARIDAQIEDWKDRTSRSRDENWLRSAQRAAEAKEKLLRIAHNLRMKLLRDGDMAEIVAGRDRQIEQLVRDGRAAREKVEVKLRSERTAVENLMSLIAERCPDLADEARAAVQAGRSGERQERDSPLRAA